MAKDTKKKRVEKLRSVESLKRAKASARKAGRAALLSHALGGVDATVLDRLAEVVLLRRDADPAVSHSARLLSRGTEKVAQKFGEEAVECLIEAIAGRREPLIGESADLLYHLIVLWVNAGVRPGEVWAELKRREGISGIAEKASRARALPRAAGLSTTKIP
ncbi:MAG: phosphoribosyl-ATP diphosphatase [Acetobacteraceae bacterium]|nr:phosphoribosyl-ATP diphosphatase [Acetobacteraceae bacterium]